LALAKFQAVPMLKVALPIIGSFMLIRFAVYMLRHTIAPSPTLKAFERVIVYSAWSIVVLHFTGLLPELIAGLEAISVTVGKQKITLWMVIAAILSVAIAVFIALFLTGVLERRIMTLQSVDLTMRVFAAKLLRAIAVLVAVLIALPIVGIDITVLSVFGGAVGVGLGLGLQKITSNYVSGFVLLLDHSIRPGDLVTIDNRYGVVTDIKARYTVLRSLDGTESIIPNDFIVTNTLTNHSYADKSISVKCFITVTHTAPLAEALTIFSDVAKTQTRVATEPAPAALVRQITDVGIELELTVWISDPEQGQAALRSDILCATLAQFKAANIELAKYAPANAAHLSSTVRPLLP
jgi:small-conductance mechanosensitive channel